MTSFDDGTWHFDLDRYQVTADGVPLHLPESAWRFLDLLIRNRGQVLSREAMVEHLSGPGFPRKKADYAVIRMRHYLQWDESGPIEKIEDGYHYVPGRLAGPRTASG